MARWKAPAAAALALALLPAAAHATPPGENGDIAFKRYLDPERTAGAIFRISPLGADEHQLTTPPAGSDDNFPDWAPDARRVTFQRCGQVTCQVMVVGRDGGTAKALTPACPPGKFFPVCTSSYYPAFSPQGNRIAFTREFGAIDPVTDFIAHRGIWSMRPDGTDRKAVTQPLSEVFEDNEAQWSPDGSRILFVRIDNRDGRQAIFTVRPSGLGLQQVTDWDLLAGDGADWSPDGSRILFRACEPCGFEGTNLFTVRPDGTGMQQLTHTPATVRMLSASWSPDGSKITFAMDGLGRLPEIWTMNRDGTGLRAVTRTRVWDSAPDWGARLSP